jgi:hypothetical protein
MDVREKLKVAIDDYEKAESGRANAAQDLSSAEQKLKEARAQLTRQIKNNGGHPVLWHGRRFHIEMDPSGQFAAVLKVHPSDEVFLG